MADVLRRFVSVRGRRVHYRRAGEGPALVMLHGSPGDSTVLEHEIAACAERFTCFALDNPGFGASDALPGDALTVAELADATAEALGALKLPPCRIYGTHSGAAIAAELAVRWPDLVTGLVLEGLPIFTDAEIADLFEGYFEPMIPEALGGHLTSTWVRFRDQFTWFPWLSRDVRRLNPVNRPTPEEIELWVSMFYNSCRTYAPAYKAVCHHGLRARTAADALEQPTIFMASAEDMLFPHLDRLGPLKPGQRIERLAHDNTAKCAAIANFAASLPGAGAAPPLDRAPAFAGLNPANGYADTPDGQMFVRLYGDRSRPPILLVHDLPGTGHSLEATARRLSGKAFVIVPDLLGAGRSESPPEPIVEAAARAMVSLCHMLGLTEVRVAAVGAGATVAFALARQGSEFVSAIHLDRPPAPPLAHPNLVAPELPLSDEGAHWVRAWLMVRDGQVYAPWFDGRAEAQRKTQGNFDAAWLHDQTVALMLSRSTYHHLVREACAFDAVRALAASLTPVHVATDGDLPADIFSHLQTKDPAP